MKKLIFTLGLLFLCSNAWARTAIWDGGDAGALASTAANWDTDTAPVAGDIVVFDGTSADNCTWDITAAIASINTTGYGGLVTASVTMTVTGGVTFANNTFAHGNQKIILTGTQTLDVGTSGNDLYSLALEKNIAFTVTMSHDVTVAGTFSNNSFTYLAVHTLNGYNLNLKGDCTLTEGVIDGTTVFVFNGSSGATQTISSSSDASYIFKVPITINITGGGTFAMSGSFGKGVGDWTYTAGAVSYGTSTVRFTNTFALDTGGGTLQFYNLKTSGTTGSGYTCTITGDLIVNNTFTVAYRGYNIAGSYNIEAKGDITFLDTEGLPLAGSSPLLITGTGSQTLTGHSNSPLAKSLTINKPSGTLYLAGTILYGKASTNFAWTHTAGTVSAGTSTVKFSGGACTITVVSNTMSFANVSLSGAVGGSETVLSLSDNMTVTGTLTQSFRQSTINNNTIYVGGLDMSIVDGWTLNGTANLVFNGTGTWTGHASYSNALTLNATINTAGTLTIASTVSYKTGTLTYTAGTVSAGTSILKITGAATLNTNGMSWYDITQGANITLGSDLDFSHNFTRTAGAVSGAYFLKPTGATTHLIDGTNTISGFDCATGETCSFDDADVFTITNGKGDGTWQSDDATNTVDIDFTSETISSGAGTRVDSAGGVAVTTTGTITSCVNWSAPSTRKLVMVVA